MTEVGKPMLLNNDEADLKSLDYENIDYYNSFKRDGIRVELTKGDMVGRSLKRFRNPKLYDRFKELMDAIPEGVVMEGEIYTCGVPCREMSGICNAKTSRDIPDNTRIFLFGLMDDTLTFAERYKKLKDICMDKKLVLFGGNRVAQHKCHYYKSLIYDYKEALDLGYEGLVLMRGDRLYKHGRVTIKQDIGYKMKPEREDDLEILRVTERMENTNESLTNELGRSYKRNTVDAKAPTGIAATFICKLDNGEECGVTITGEEAERRKIWANKEDYVGMYAVVKSMAYGTKDKLRHPRLLKLKESCEK